MFGICWLTKPHLAAIIFVSSAKKPPPFTDGSLHLSHERAFGWPQLADRWKRCERWA